MRVIGGKTKAFALPVVLTSSLVMMLLLMVVLSGVTSSSVVLQDQYIRKLADQAAESGVNFMAGCISKNTIPSSGSFTPDATSCLNSSVDTNKSPYIVSTSNMRTRFVVGAPVLANGVYTISSSGYVDQVRTSSGTVAQTSTSSVKFRAFPGYFQSGGISVENYNRTPYVLMPDGTVYGWGDNASGQVGNGVTGGTVSVPTKVYSGVASVVKAAYLNDDAYVITNTGQLYAWGKNAYGMVGDGTTTVVNAPKLISVGSGGKVIDIKANWYTVYALKDDGSVWAWGQNTYGQVGNNSTTDQLSPVQVVAASGTNPVTKLIEVHNSFYSGSMYVIRQDGSVLAWGRNNNGQVGNGQPTTNNQLTPTQIIGNATPVGNIVVSGAPPANFSVTALLQNGTMVRWGYGVAAAPVFTLTPTAISGITSISRIFSSAVGTTFALSSTGKLYAWGINTSGNVGNGTITSPVYTPYDVFPAGPNIVDLNNTKFEAATMAIGSDNSVYTWGENTNCGIGDGTTTRRLTPYNVIAAYSANVTTPKIFANSNGGYGVGASYATMYAIKADGTVWSWGDNTYGQVGDGSTTDRCTPYQVLTGVVTGTASDYYSVYIVKADKTIWSWGNNGYGQLGRTGSTTAPGKISLPAIPPLSF